MVYITKTASHDLPHAYKKFDRFVIFFFYTIQSYEYFLILFMQKMLDLRETLQHCHFMHQSWNEHLCSD